MNPRDTELARRLYTPPAADLIKNLTDLGDGLAGQFAELQRHPTAPACEQLAINLQGAVWVVMQITPALMFDSELAHDRD